MPTRGERGQRLSDARVHFVLTPPVLGVAYAVQRYCVLHPSRIVGLQQAREALAQRRPDAAAQHVFVRNGSAQRRQRVDDRAADACVVVGERAVEIEQQRRGASHRRGRTGCTRYSSTLPPASASQLRQYAKSPCAVKSPDSLAGCLDVDRNDHGIVLAEHDAERPRLSTRRSGRSRDHPWPAACTRSRGRTARSRHRTGERGAIERRRCACAAGNDDSAASSSTRRASPASWPCAPVLDEHRPAFMVAPATCDLDVASRKAFARESRAAHERDRAFVVRLHVDFDAMQLQRAKRQGQRERETLRHVALSGVGGRARSSRGTRSGMLRGRCR